MHYDNLIIYATGGFILTIVGARFALHEVRSLVREYRELRAEMLEPLSSSPSREVSKKVRASSVLGLLD